MSSVLNAPLTSKLEKKLNTYYSFERILKNKKRINVISHQSF